MEPALMLTLLWMLFSGTHWLAIAQIILMTTTLALAIGKLPRSPQPLGAHVEVK